MGWDIMAVQSFDQFICLNGVGLENFLVVIHSNYLLNNPSHCYAVPTYARISSNKIGYVIVYLIGRLLFTRHVKVNNNKYKKHF